MLGFRRQDPRLAIERSGGDSGFDPERPSWQTGFRLLGARERIGFLGGDMEVAGAPDEGGAVTLTVPPSPENPVQEIRP